MIWKTVRLELARGEGNPTTSASRAYVLRVPLDENGLIDHRLVARNPSRATARRFWSSEPDQYGIIEGSDGHWILRCRGPQGETQVRMPLVPLRLNGQIMVEDPTGTSNTFRVVSVKNNGAAASVES